jgi:hypothetical protein
MRAAEIINPMRLQEVTQHRPHLYLDMDGVQADFFTAWAKLSGKQRYKEIGDRAQREASIADLNARGAEFVEQFFATLPVLSGAQTLIKFLRDNDIKYTILSAPLRGNEEASIRGKLAWLDRYHPGTSGTAIFTDEKQRYSTTNGNPNVLVDDFKKYVNAWSADGGIAVLYRWNNVAGAIDQLRKIYGIDQPGRVNSLEALREATLGTLYPPTILGTARIDDIVIALSKHLYDRAEERKIPLSKIESTIRRLRRVKSKMKQHGPGSRFWVHNPYEEIALGFQVLDSGAFKVNTVIAEPPHAQGEVPIIRMYENEQGVAEGVNQVDFNKNLLTILQQKYPSTEFSIQLDRVESADGELTVIANIAEQGSYVGCFMWDVNTGPYTGALGLAIKQTTDQLLQANPGKKPALFIGGDNENPEAWAHIADKLNYKLITDDDELEEGVAEGSPNFDFEWDEATRYPEFVNLGKEKWIELVSKGKPVTVTRKNVNKINNTDAADPKSFKLLDPEKQKRALAQLANGDVEMPIVARYSDGYLELIGGNTRLTAQMAKDGKAKVWLFYVPE